MNAHRFFAQKWPDEYFKQLERVKADEKGAPNYWEKINQLVMSRVTRDAILDRTQEYKNLQGISGLKRSNMPFHYLTKHELQHILDCDKSKNP